MKSWLQYNYIEMYSKHNELKSVLLLKDLLEMTLISKKVYIDKLVDTINKYNNTCNKTIKMKPINVKYNTYINFGKEVNDKNPKF